MFFPERLEKLPPLGHRALSGRVVSRFGLAEPESQDHEGSGYGPAGISRLGHAAAEGARHAKRVPPLQVEGFRETGQDRLRAVEP